MRYQTFHCFPFQIILTIIIIAIIIITITLQITVICIQIMVIIIITFFIIIINHPTLCHKQSTTNQYGISWYDIGNDKILSTLEKTIKQIKGSLSDWKYVGKYYKRIIEVTIDI